MSAINHSVRDCGNFQRSLRYSLELDRLKRQGPELVKSMMARGLIKLRAPEPTLAPFIGGPPRRGRRPASSTIHHPSSS